MHRVNCFPFVVLLLLTTIATQAQNRFKATITLSPQLDPKQLRVSYDNGQDVIEVPSTFTGGAMTLSGEYYSRYATLILAYPKAEFILSNNRYYLTAKPATITFYSDSSNVNPFFCYTLTNAVVVDSTRDAKRLNNYLKKEKEQLEVITNNNPKYYESDSLSSVMNQLFKAMDEKKLTFIKSNPNSYYALQLFLRQTVWDYATSAPDSLLKVFEGIFPAHLKQSIEGKEVVKLLKGRALVKGAAAPTFVAKDITGNTIDLKHYQGKYVLLNFWASWCVPCVEKIPSLKDLRERYSTETLEMVSITSDEDTAAFQKALDKYRMNWMHIYGNKDVINRYGNRPLPSLYLLDKNGKIIFNLDEDGEQDLLLRLNSLIK